MKRQALPPSSPSYLACLFYILTNHIRFQHMIHIRRRVRCCRQNAPPLPPLRPPPLPLPLPLPHPPPPRRVIACSASITDSCKSASASFCSTLCLTRTPDNSRYKCHLCDAMPCDDIRLSVPFVSCFDFFNFFQALSNILRFAHVLHRYSLVCPILCEC